MELELNRKKFRFRASYRSLLGWFVRVARHIVCKERERSQFRTKRPQNITINYIMQNVWYDRFSYFSWPIRAHVDMIKVLLKTQVCLVHSGWIVNIHLRITTDGSKVAKFDGKRFNKISECFCVTQSTINSKTLQIGPADIWNVLTFIANLLRYSDR